MEITNSIYNIKGLFDTVVSLIRVRIEEKILILLLKLLRIFLVNCLEIKLIFNKY